MAYLCDVHNCGLGDDCFHVLPHIGLYFPQGVDWRDERNWECNDNVHPSRHGTYDGIAMHPYETVFVKASWHVGDPYTSRYSRWQLVHLTGDNGTAGQLNETMYRYAISS